jgi:hypothetical protein
MRKIIASLFLAAAVSVVCSARDYTPASGQSANTFSGVNTVTGSFVASGTGFVAATAQTDTNATTSVTTKTPKYVGQILVGATGSTSSVWVAKGVTTNDWVKVAGPE